jgi:hypothetical protein
MKSSMFLLMICLFSSCAKPCKESEKILKHMVQLLSYVESKEDMQQVAPLFKKDVEKLTFLMIEAKSLQIKKGAKEEVLINLELSEKLEKELIRVLQIEGVENIISEVEKDSLHRLDAFDRQIQ